MLLREAGIAARGFVTDEMRERGERVGFAIETLGGDRAMLAHVELPGPLRVSRYGVDLAAFEALAIPTLEAVRDDEVVVIDEIGKMELASRPFRASLSAIFARDVRVVATIQLAHDTFTDALKRRRDVEVLKVTSRSRDELPSAVFARLE